jgi:hypothetical protein
MIKIMLPGDMCCESFGDLVFGSFSSKEFFWSESEDQDECKPVFVFPKFCFSSSSVNFCTVAEELDGVGRFLAGFWGVFGAIRWGFWEFNFFSSSSLKVRISSAVFVGEESVLPWMVLSGELLEYKLVFRGEALGGVVCSNVFVGDFSKAFVRVCSNVLAGDSTFFVGDFCSKGFAGDFCSKLFVGDICSKVFVGDFWSKDFVGDFCSTVLRDSSSSPGNRGVSHPEFLSSVESNSTERSFSS